MRKMKKKNKFKRKNDYIHRSNHSILRCIFIKPAFMLLFCLLNINSLLGHFQQCKGGDKIKNGNKSTKRIFRKLQAKLDQVQSINISLYQYVLGIIVIQDQNIILQTPRLKVSSFLVPEINKTIRIEIINAEGINNYLITVSKLEQVRLKK